MKKLYALTEKAGDFIAGRRIVGDARKKHIELTEKQARYELNLGTIKPVVDSVSVEPETKAKSAK